MEEKSYPRTVRKLVTIHSAWIVGGAVFEDDPKDIDVAVSHKRWDKASQIIPISARPNSYGGWKFEEDGISIDVWPAYLEDIMCNIRCKAVYHPATKSLFVRQDETF